VTTNGTCDLGSPFSFVDEILTDADLKHTVRPTECSTSTEQRWWFQGKALSRTRLVAIDGNSQGPG
jgi:hypothetical protein